MAGRTGAGRGGRGSAQIGSGGVSRRRGSSASASSSPKDPVCANDDFPSVFEPATKTMSLIVPAYNEEVRLPKMLDETLHYLESRQQRDPNFSYEIIVVDDGSRDNTSRVALAYSKMKGTDRVRLLQLHCNHGRKGAVRGMLRARGALLLMVDADAAARISDVERLEHQVRVVAGRGVAIGSRHHLQADAVAQRACHQSAHAWFQFVCLDAVCTRRQRHAVWFQALYSERCPGTISVQHIERWAFDVELLHLCSRLTAFRPQRCQCNGSRCLDRRSICLRIFHKWQGTFLIIRMMYSCRIWTTSIRTKRTDAYTRYNSKSRISHNFFQRNTTISTLLPDACYCTLYLDLVLPQMSCQ